MANGLESGVYCLNLPNKNHPKNEPWNSPTLNPISVLIYLSFFDHPKLEFACVGEKNDNKLFLYFLIRMLTGVKAKKLQMYKE